MHLIHTPLTASISELKKSPTELIQKAGNQALSILNHNVPTAYLVPTALFHQMLEIIDEYELNKEVTLAKKYKQKAIKVKLDELNLSHKP